MRETLPSARSDEDPLRRFSMLYTGMKWCTGRRQSTERFVGRRYVSREKPGQNFISHLRVSIRRNFHVPRVFKLLYSMSDGTATEPVWTLQMRTEYARRMHVVRTTLSIAIARTTANTLLHKANTLLVTGHTF